MPHSTFLHDLSPEHRSLVDSLVRGFSERWHEKLLAEWIKKLPEAGHLARRAALIEMVKIDLRRQWQNGRRACIEAYLHFYPELGSRDSVPAELIQAECDARQEMGAGDTLDLVAKRFPGQAEEIRRAGLTTPTQSHASSSQSTSGVAEPAKQEPALPIIPGYEVVGVLGRGGMGIVYRARQIRLKRLVALKMTRAGTFADGGDVARFRLEAEAAARLQHANIVQIFEIGEHSNVPYFAMELVNGPSLHSRLRKELPVPPAAARVMQLLARAVHYAHERSIVHRDLKPANILLAHNSHAPRGDEEESSPLPWDQLTPKITDFGLAKHLDDDSGQTQTGQIMGTASYMAPEQAAGRISEIGPHTDVYALGAILYELLTGRPPFRGASTIETLEQVRTELPTPPRKLQPKTPYDLQTICLKCLEKDAAKRYASAELLAADLGRFLEQLPILARPVGPIERSVRWCRRYPAVASLLTGLLVLLPLLVLGWWSADANRRTAEQNETTAKKNYAAMQQARTAEKQARQQSDLEHAAKVKEFDRAEKNLEQFRKRSYDAEMSQAWEAWHTGRIRRTGELLRRQFPPQDRKDLRGFEWFALWKKCFAEKSSWRTNHFVYELSFAPDGNFLACFGANKGSTISIWNPLTGRALGALRPDHAQTFALSPDGKTLAVGCGIYVIHDENNKNPPEMLTLYDLATGKSRPPFKWAGANSVESLAFSPDGKTLLMGGLVNGPVVVWDVDSGLARARLSAGLINGNNDFVHVAFSPKGDLFAARTYGGDVTVWDAVTLEQRDAFKTSNGSTSGNLVFSPDGQWLAVTGYGGAALFDVRRRSHFWLADTPALNMHYTCAAISPDSRTLALTCGAGDNRFSITQLWDISNRTKSATLPGHPGGVYAAAFHPRGDLLATGGKDGSVKLWDLPKPRQLNDNLYVFRLEVSPDGQQLAIAHANLLRLCNLQTQEEIVIQLDVREQAIRDTHFSPDSKTIAVVTSDAKSGILTLWDCRTGAALPLTPPELDARAAAEVAGICALPVLPMATWARFTMPKQLATQSGVIQSARFSPDGKALAVTGEAKTEIWELPTLRLKFDLAKADLGHRNGPSDYSPDGKMLAVAGRSPWLNINGRIDVWDAQTGAKLFRLPGHPDPVNGIVFSPDGSLLASASRDKSVAVWDIAARKRRWTFEGHSDQVVDLAFHPDGTRLVSVAAGKEVKLWDLTSGEELATLAQSAYRVVFHPDGKTLVVGARGLEQFEVANAQAVDDYLVRESHAMKPLPLNGKIWLPPGLIPPAELPSVPSLIEQLGEGELAQQTRAVMALVRHGDGALRAVHSALRHENAQVRKNAARAIRLVGVAEPDVTATLEDLLNDPDVAVGLEAAWALAVIGQEKTALTYLVNKLTDMDGPIRAEAVRVLAAIGTPAVPELDRALKAESTVLRLGALQCLTLMRLLGRELIPQVVAARDDADEQIRAQAGKVLVNLGPPAIEYLARELGHKAPDRRLKAVAHLGLFPSDANADKAVREALKHSDEAVRRAAADALKKVAWKDVDIRDRLALLDPFDAVRTSSHHKIHEVRLQAGARYQVDLTSKEIDPFLRIEDAARTRLAFDDDGGDGLNSRLIFQPAVTGIYRLIVTSYTPQTGEYALTIREIVH